MPPQIIIVMGVSGSGKSTVGERLARSLGWDFRDADTFHPPANIDKMRQGVPLDDRDRLPWLHALQREIDRRLQAGSSVVLACSALKRRYRQMLRCDRPSVALVYLKGSFDLIAARIDRRERHFMGTSLLRSQFATLEEPQEAIAIDISASPEAIVRQICQHLREGNRGKLG